MLKNKEKEILKNLRSETKKELLKQNLAAPLFSIQCDYRTKKLKLNYSYPKYKIVSLMTGNQLFIGPLNIQIY